MLYLFVTVKCESQIPSIIISDVLFEIDDYLTFQDFLQQANIEYEVNELVKVKIHCVGNKQCNTFASAQSTECSLSPPKSDGKETTIGKQFLENFNILLWKLDEHHQKLKEQGCHLPEFILSLHGYQNN
ncbi:3941_t:CDS:2, partial [Dentiscutata heterogama]